MSCAFGLMKPYPFLTPGVTSHATPLLLPLIPERDVQLFSSCLPPALSFPSSPDNLWTSSYSHLQCPDQFPQELKKWVGELCFYIFLFLLILHFNCCTEERVHLVLDAAEICPGRVELRVVGVMDSYLHVWLSLWSLGRVEPARSVNFHRFTLNIFAAFCHTITLLKLIRQLVKSTCPRSPARSCICWLMSHCAIRRRCWRLGSGARVWVERAWIKVFTPSERGWM